MATPTKNKRWFAWSVAVTYALAAVIIPFLHETGFIFPHDHCACVIDHQSPDGACAEIHANENCHSRSHGTECPICYFKNLLGGIKYHSADTYPALFYRALLPAITDINTPRLKYLLQRSARAPPPVATL